MDPAATRGPALSDVHDVSAAARSGGDSSEGRQDPLPRASSTPAAGATERLEAKRVRQWQFARCVREALNAGGSRFLLDVVLDRLGGP
jgi:hypothetical protein